MSGACVGLSPHHTPHHTTHASTGRNLTEALLKFNPAKRLSSSELLLHPWIQGHPAFGSSTTAPIGGGGGTLHASSANIYSTNNVLDLMRLYKIELAKRRVFTAVLAVVRLARRWLKHPRRTLAPMGAPSARKPRMEGVSELGLNEMPSAPPRGRWMGKRGSLCFASPTGAVSSVAEDFQAGRRPHHHASSSLAHPRHAPTSLSQLALPGRQREGPPATFSMPAGPGSGGARRKSTDRLGGQSVQAIDKLVQRRLREAS